MMIADIVAAVKAARAELEDYVNDEAYLVGEIEELTGEIERDIDTIQVTGIRIDGEITNVIFEYTNGDIDELTLSEFANNTYATATAAAQEMERRR